MAISLPGLGSGLDTESMVTQLMALERRPQQLLAARKAAADKQLASWGTISTALQGLSTAASALGEDKNWTALTTASSNTAVATASTASGTTTLTPGGELRFRVGRLATAGSLVSTSAVAGLGTTVASGNLVLATGLDRLGITDVSAGTLPTGGQTVTVTQSSAAANLTGSAPVVPVTIDATNDTVEATVNGSVGTFTLTHGTYTTAAGLAAALGGAMGSDVTVGTASGALSVSTVRHGSEAALEFTGGTALADLGLGSLAAATGTDGRISVGGTMNTVSSIDPGAQVGISGPSGSTAMLTLSGPLVAGTSRMTVVATGTGSLADVVNAVNKSGSGLSAAAVQVAPGSYRLQVASAATGAGSNPMVSAGTLTGLSMTTLSSGVDASITMGDGPAAYQVQSSSNSFAGLLPGVNVTVVKESTDLVTVSARTDTNALATKVDQLVGVFNATVAGIKKEFLNTNDPKNPAPLAGDSGARRLVDQLYSAFTSSGTSSLSGRGVGLSVGRDGRVSFDRGKFTQAFEADPTAVSEVFKRVTTFTDSRVTVSSQPSTVPVGSYTVSVSSPATRATVTGATMTGALAAPESITVAVGATSATYAAAAGETAAQVAAGITAALANANIGVSAEVVSGALRLRAETYGSATGFSVSSTAAGSGQTGLVGSAGATVTASGTDVAGTFTRGTTTVSATGRGQLLTADPNDVRLKGLTLRVSVDGAETPSMAPATMSYKAGLAQALSVIGTNATGTGGVATAAQDGRRSIMKTLDGQIADWTTRLSQRETSLRQTFTRLDTAMSKASSTQSWLSGQLSGLQNNG